MATADPFTTQPVEISPPRPLALDWRKVVPTHNQAVGIAAIVLAYLAVGLGDTVLGPLSIVGLVLCWAFRDRVEEVPFEFGRAPRLDVAMELEKKAVAALVGTGFWADLAQTYALFGQRHPRDSLLPDTQRDLSLELLDHGYKGIGLEALDKVLSSDDYRGDPRLMAIRREVLLEDPAYTGEALKGDTGSTETRDLEPLDVAVLREALDRPPDTSPVCLLSLLTRGWGVARESSIRLPSDPDNRAMLRSQLIAGPLSRADAVESLASCWDAEEPTICLPASVLSLPPRVERVRQLHLSQKRAVFSTDRGERSFRWEQITSAIYARVAVTRRRKEWQPQDSSVLFDQEADLFYVTVEREETDLTPVLEIHAMPGPIRLRIDLYVPGLYDYLGRRRDVAHTSNLVLAAKDVARFGPSIRLSHGLMCLLRGRPGPWLRFTDMHRFEEYALWFWALGTETVKGIWRPVRERLRTLATA